MTWHYARMYGSGFPSFSPLDALAAAAGTWGTGATGSRLATGATELPAELERELAAFGDAPGALVLSSGYRANLALVTALAAALDDGGGVLPVSDARHHAWRRPRRARRWPRSGCCATTPACRPGDAVAAQRICAAAGVRVGCFRPPSVPDGEACLRLTGRASLSEIDLGLASRVLAEVQEHCHHGRNTAKAGRYHS